MRLPRLLLRTPPSPPPPPPTHPLTRPASHKAQGSVNGGKNGAGKRLGAKKSGEQYVIPGNIIFRQRGTLWFPGENAGMGRDHTIFAREAGYVKYYLDPAQPKRRFIGVAFLRAQSLPTPVNKPRLRRLNMVAKPMAAKAENEVEEEVAGKKGLAIRPGYMYREANWEIGRVVERREEEKRAESEGQGEEAKRKRVRPEGKKAHFKPERWTAGVRVYKRGDRWVAWQKSRARIVANGERKGLRRKGRA
ncbi:MAG: 54S ribosomal protein L2 mitochondrial [Trizodia sp. TS-e1964]|nr:MAG: 54S ribosomal protein L2 mitochondrial [Trizodia sp. TS-e1964]